MSEPVMSKPGTDHEVEVDEVPPLVLVSSRDGRDAPGVDLVSNRSAAWRGLAARAEKCGWTVTTTYALAWKQARMFSTGRVAKAAHLVHSVAIRLVRGAERAFAVWVAESKVDGIPAAGWAFSVAGAGRHATKDKAAWTAFVTAPREAS